MKGLLCFIVGPTDGANFSNGGLSSRCNKVILCDPPAELTRLGYLVTGVPTIFSPSDDCPAVFLRQRVIGSKTYIHAVPADKAEDGSWVMMGGCFIHSCDSRFPADYPIPLHDREEA